MQNVSGILLYVLIFLGQVAQVTVSTVRLIFMNKGNRKMVMALCFVEYALYVMIISSVLVNIYSDPFKIVVYVVSTVVGMGIGMVIESKMAVGFTSLQVVCAADRAEIIGKALKDHQFGVTILDGHSVDGTKRSMLFIQVKRRRVEEARNVVHSVEPGAVVSQSEVQSVCGGFVK